MCPQPIFRLKDLNQKTCSLLSTRKAYRKHMAPQTSLDTTVSFRKSVSQLSHHTPGIILFFPPTSMTWTTWCFSWFPLVMAYQRRFCLPDRIMDNFQQRNLRQLWMKTGYTLMTKTWYNIQYDKVMDKPIAYIYINLKKHCMWGCQVFLDGTDRTVQAASF
jgi:hypothetical protein